MWHNIWEANHVEYRTAPFDSVLTSFKFNSCKIRNVLNAFFFKDTTATNCHKNYKVLQNKYKEIQNNYEVLQNNNKITGGKNTKRHKTTTKRCKTTTIRYKTTKNEAGVWGVFICLLPGAHCFINYLGSQLTPKEWLRQNSPKKLNWTTPVCRTGSCQKICCLQAKPTQQWSHCMLCYLRLQKGPSCVIISGSHFMLPIGF